MNTTPPSKWKRRVHRIWPWLARALATLIALTITILLIRLAREVDWQEVYLATRTTPSATLAAGVAATAVGYLAYATMDTLARRYFGHRQTLWKTQLIAATSYAFNMSLGAILGGGAIRLRLYHHAGLKTASVAGIVVFTSLTNWLGYCLLSPVFLISNAPERLAQLHIKTAITHSIGVLLFLVAIGYLVLSACQGGKTLRLRGHSIKVPEWRMALAQSMASVVSWNAMFTVIYLLLNRQVDYLDVMGLMMFSSFAAMMAHIPAGLGVIEAIFAATLGDVLSAPHILAAVLMFRAVYQWLPLGLALPALLIMEIRKKWMPS